MLADLYPQYDIGRHSYGTPKIVRWSNSSQLTIGSYCSIASEAVILLGGEHRSDWVTTYPFPTAWSSASQFAGHPVSKGDVRIGNDVWIGTRTLILSGVTIGDGACIGAGSVVASSIPPYSIAAGNPCRILRFRFTDDQISELLRVAWWEWQEADVETALPYLLNDDIEAFIEYARRSQLA